MLDVHAPQGSIHGWREFLTHIAAIAIGLLLALALEKLMEDIHEHRQLGEARRELATEVAENRRSWQNNMVELERVRQELRNDLNIIQALRANAPVAEKFDYSVGFYATRDGPWQAVKQSGSLSLMPHSELQSYAWFHQILAYLMEALHAVEPVMKIANAIATSAPEGKLSARDLDELASKTMEAQGRLDNVGMFLKLEQNGLESFSPPARSPSQ